MNWMTEKEPNYVIRVGDAFSQFINAAFLRGNPNESVSGRCYRVHVLEGNDSKRWRYGYGAINWVFSLWPFRQENHCKEAYWGDLVRSDYYRERHNGYMGSEG